MPLDIERFVRLRPVLYHLTATPNAARIRDTGLICPASALYRSAGMTPSIRTRRAKGQWIEFGGERVHIRDQAPLHRGNIMFSGGWKFEDLVAHLNDHVFFWPGTASGPIAYGLRHFQRYAGDDTAVLSFDTRAVFAANLKPGPRFCKYNSGSPRCSKGRGSPRGPDTFLDARAFPHNPSEVIEVTFPSIVSLDGCTVTQQPVRDLIGPRL